MNVTAPRDKRRVLGMVFLTVFIDMVGFSIIFPLFPHMLDYYVGLEGETSAIGRLTRTLATISGDRFAVVTLFGGVLGSLYSLLQFLFAPVWGRFSDVVGRRPALLLTLCGTAAAHLLWVFSGSFAVLVAARLLGGVMAGNISTASAVVADSCPGTDRARGMGILGAGIGLGFVIGPAIGGLTSIWDMAATFPWATSWGINPFSACALAAFVLAAFNLLWVYRGLPETHGGISTGAGKGEMVRTIHPFRALGQLRFPGVKGTNLAYFVYQVAFSAMEFTLTFLAVERLHYEERDNMWMFVFVGITIAVVQGGLVRRVVPAAGEKRVAVAGISLTVPGLVVVGWAGSNVMLYAGLALLAIGSGLVMPTLGALASRYTPDDRQGLALGVFRSMGALARAIGPVMGGLLYWRVGSWAPYALGSFLVAISLTVTAGLPQVSAWPQPQRP